MAQQGEVLVVQDWRPEFSPWKLHMGRRRGPAPRRCPLTFIQVPRCMFPPHVMHINKLLCSFWVFFFFFKKKERFIFYGRGRTMEKRPVSFELYFWFPQKQYDSKPRSWKVLEKEPVGQLCPVEQHCHSVSPGLWLPGHPTLLG